VKPIALTFDDGPGDVTGALLDVLARHDARATFYWLGELVAGHEAVCGVHPRRFRPPYGSTNAALEAAVAEYGLETVLWDVDPRDWEDPGPAVVRDRTLAALRPGAVVLLHERPGTVDAVELILGDLYG
jgi:peptidoglycan/xylan/chitin deacetylase (PgdA/CDA1 family)